MSTRLNNYISHVYLYLENDYRKPPDSRLTITQKRAEKQPVVNMVVVQSTLPSVLFQ